MKILNIFLIVFLIGIVSASQFDFPTSVSGGNNIYMINNDTEIFHNNMSGIQGGSSSERYHLSQTIYNFLVNNWNNGKQIIYSKEDIDYEIMIRMRLIKEWLVEYYDQDKLIRRRTK